MAKLGLLAGDLQGCFFTHLTQHVDAFDARDLKQALRVVESIEVASQHAALVEATPGCWSEIDDFTDLERARSALRGR